jgi:hypothetical protein
MKVKTYKATIFDVTYYIKAPNKRVAQWCGLNLYHNNYPSFTTVNDVKVELVEEEEVYD